MDSNANNRHHHLYRSPQNYHSRKPFLHGHNQTHFKAIFLTLLLMQHAQLFGCHRTTHTELPRRSPVGERNEKRSPLVSDSGSVSSQPEEIFYAGNQLEMNYDEYPMVVPKRAALLLDRLMVALHRALEREQQRFYPNKTGNPNGKNAKSATVADKNAMSPPPSDIGDERIAMYSDDDPSVIMDYDFKDLSSINRATGETLMEKSFQRRANFGVDFVGGRGGDIATDNVIALLTPNSDVNMGGGGGGSAVSSARHKSIGSGGGRMYWRCYFNAVSCF